MNLTEVSPHPFPHPFPLPIPHGGSLGRGWGEGGRRPGEGKRLGGRGSRRSDYLPTGVGRKRSLRVLISKGRKLSSMAARLTFSLRRESSNRLASSAARTWACIWRVTD